MTAQNILDLALDLISERINDGSRPVDIDFFNSRAVSYINITLAECAPYDAMLTRREIDFIPVSALTDEVCVEPAIAYGAMPCNVAALYMLAAEDDRYRLFRTMFENALLKATRLRNGRIHSITDIY